MKRFNRLALLLAATVIHSSTLHAAEANAQIRLNQVGFLAHGGKSAWLMATAPDASVRNGGQAITLARSAIAMTPADDPDLRDVLAAAYAETGEFDRASAQISRAIIVADSRANKQLAADLRSRQKLYVEKKPYRSTNSLRAPRLSDLSVEK